MWSAITSAISRDLTEFAAVVSSDAAQLIHAAAKQGAPVTGDEDFPETVAMSHNTLSDDAIVELQANLDTFRIPLSDVEMRELKVWPNYDRAIETSRWQRLLTESAEIQDAYEVCVENEDPSCTDEEFFLRYFWRLSRARLEAQRRHALDMRSGGGGGSDHAASSRTQLTVNDQGDILFEWNDEDTMLSSPPPKNAEAASSKDVTPINDDSASSSDAASQQKYWKSKAKQLEGVVAALQAQVERLQNENRALKQHCREHAAAASPGTGEVIAENHESSSDSKKKMTPRAETSSTPLRTTTSLQQQHSPALAAGGGGSPGGNNVAEVLVAESTTTAVTAKSQKPPSQKTVPSIASKNAVEEDDDDWTSLS